MSFLAQTVRDIQVKNQTVLVSVDFNVPGDDKGNVIDDYRVEASLPTLQYLLQQNCKIVLISHRGRPKGEAVPALSLKPVAPILEKLLRRPVRFLDNCIGQQADEAKKGLKEGEVLLLENVRFHAEEEKNDSSFAKKLANGCDVFVQDAFAKVHRAHASTVAITKLLPSVSGLLLEKEVTTIVAAMKSPKRPLMAVVGGAKIADKIDVVRMFIKHADFVAIGGAMANTFLLAKGLEVGESLVEKDDVELAKKIMEEAAEEAEKRPFTFYLPQDSVVAESLKPSAKTRIVDWDAHVIAAIENYPKQAPARSGRVAKDELILDIGPFSGAFIAGSMQFAETVIWNGVMGVTETRGTQGPVGPFAHGTELVVDAMLGHFGNKPFTIVGGGDTVGYIEQRGLSKGFGHVSTGGGACLELMAGKKLPGLEALKSKK